MTTFKHVFNTWLLAHVFHPFLFCLSMMAIDEAVSIEAIPIVIVAGPIGGIPSFVFSWLFLHWLRYSTKPLLLLQGYWFLLVSAAIVMNVLLLVLLAGIPKLFFDIQSYILPAVISSWVSILARTAQFQNLFTFKSIDNEDSLV